MTEQPWRVRLRAFTTTISSQFWASEPAVSMSLALVIGAGAGIAAAAVIWLLDTLIRLVFVDGASAFSFMGRSYLILAPALGGLAAGAILRLRREQATGLDVADIIVAIVTLRGHVELAPALAKALAAITAIGAGGSAGREGAIMRLGAAIGSAVSRRVRLNERRTITLVAAGAAAGLAASFNAPLAGVMFGVEVILAGVGVQSFGALIVSAVAASAVSRSLLGEQIAFTVPAIVPPDWWELAFVAGLGLLAAVAAVAFARFLTAAEVTVASWQLPMPLRLALAGLAVGFVGYVAPQALGLGFTSIADALRGNLAPGLLLLLVLAKALTTSLTVGSGAAGSIFGPLLFAGAMLGAAYGQAVHGLMPVAGAANYALIGMAAVLAGGIRAPATAILLVFELSRAYRLLPALLVATAASVIVARLMERRGIYAHQLWQRGVEAHALRDADLMQTILVEDAMTPAEGMTVVTPATPLSELGRVFEETGHHGGVVIDEAGQLSGIVTLSDLERAVRKGSAAQTVADICTRNVVTVFPDESLDDAVRLFASLDVGRLPVVQRNDPRRVVGLLRRSGIVRAYAQALASTPETTDQAERASLQSAAGADVAEFVLTGSDYAAGRRLRELALPVDCVIISIHRRGRVVVPRGNAMLQAGDRVIILKISTSVETLRTILRNGGEGGAGHE